VRRLLLLTVLAALGLATPAHAASFQVGLGSNPGVALDEAGNAVVGWMVGNTYSVQVCFLPARARACAATTAIPFPGQGYGRSRVSVLMPAPNIVDVVVPRSLNPVYETFLARSVDGGRTFGPPIKISDTGFGQAVLTPDGRIALSGSSAVLNAGLVRSDGADAATRGSSLGETIDGLYDDIVGLGPELFVASSAAGKTQAYKLAAGADPNAPDAWLRLPDLPLGRQPELTAGPAGLVALLEPISPTTPSGLFVQRLVGGNWTAPATINADHAGNNDFEFAQNGSGRLTALWTTGLPYRLNYTTSIDGGVLWSSVATVALYGGFPSDLEMATASNGAGIAVVGTSSGDNEPIRVARFTPRTAPLAQRRIGSATVQARAVCSSIGHFGVVIEASRNGARISPSAVLRRASFGRVRGARRTFSSRFRAGYEPTRSSLRVPVRLRPRSGRSRGLTVRTRRCNVPAG
jgi:hypothetical protein